MLCPRLLHPSLSPFMDLHWPVRSLWPDNQPLFFQLEQERMRHMQEIRHSLEYMERLRQRIFQEIDAGPSSGVFRSVPFLMGAEGGCFSLTLDTKDFSPEELSVKQVGRKLRVSGKKERKQGDGKGSYSYRCEEFRQEFDVPEGVKPEAVTCSLVGGQLQIQAPREGVEEAKERMVPIELTPTVKGQPPQEDKESNIVATESPQN